MFSFFANVNDTIQMLHFTYSALTFFTLVALEPGAFRIRNFVFRGIVFPCNVKPRFIKSLFKNFICFQVIKNVRVVTWWEKCLAKQRIIKIGKW